MIAMFKLFYNTIAACQRPVGPLLSNKCNYVNDCLYCVSCVVYYKVEKLRSKYGAKLQHVFFNIFFSRISSKMSKLGLKTKKVVEIKTVVEHVEI